MATSTHLFRITCMTNMHVGSGGTNYGIIDNLVQRDPTTGYPTIHASSLKGALREFCGQHGKLKSEQVRHIFGSDVKDGGERTVPGNYRFFSAHLLSIPVRSNKQPYYNATSVQSVNDFVTFCESLNIGLNADNKAALTDFAGLANSPLIFDGGSNAMVEGKEATQGTLEKAKREKVETFIGSRPALYSDSDFEELMKGMPVIARNNLENGISQNLWYEEIVPRQSRFYFAVMHDGNHFDDFSTKIEEGMVQIGANASVGYGFCKITKMELL